MDDAERKTPAPEADVIDSLRRQMQDPENVWRQIRNMALWERTQKAWRAFKEEHVNVAEAVREAGVPKYELASLLLGRKAGAGLFVDKAWLEEERVMREIGGSSLPLPEVVPPAALYELYRANQDAAVARLAGALEHYCLQRSDWEALKAALKPAGKGGQDADAVAPKRKASYELIIAALWAQFDVQSGQAPEANAIARRGVAAEISKLVHSVAWPGGEQRTIGEDAVRNIIKEIQVDILQ